MAENPEDQDQDEEVTDEQVEEFYRGMKKSAKEWRERLKDPLLQNLVKAGTVRISPLVYKLLEAFPETE